MLNNSYETTHLLFCVKFMMRQKITDYENLYIFAN